MASTSIQPDFKELSQKAVAANKDHQYALKVYTERLESELQTVDKLLAAAELPDVDIDLDTGGSLVIPDAVKAFGPVSHGITYEESPFAEDAAKRRRYLKATVIHQMKTPELEALSDAVQSENRRLFALEAQRRGQQPFVALNEHPRGFFEINKVGLDWDRIAKKVSDAGVNYVHRSAEDCQVRWLGDRHPDFNHSDWSEEEIARIKELVGDAKEGEVDWVDLAAKLGTNRTPVDCMRHAIQRKVHVWTPEADIRLLEAVSIYGTENWLQVARQVSEDATSAQCQNRYVRSIDPSIKRGPWTADEDALLRSAVDVFGRSWVEVSAWVPGRNNEQCRERWPDAQKDSKRGPWTEVEDQALLEAYAKIGEAKWREISKMIGSGRTDSMCRHRYAVLMKRRDKEAAMTDASGTVDFAGPSSLDKGPVAGPSKPRKRAITQQTPEEPLTPTADIPLAAETETPAPSPAKTQSRPRGNRAISELKQPQKKSAVRPRPRPRHAPEAAQGSGNKDSGKGDTAEVKPTQSKRGRGRPRKHPLPQDESESPQQRPAAKKKRITSVIDTEADPSNEFANDIVQPASHLSDILSCAAALVTINRGGVEEPSQCGEDTMAAKHPNEHGETGNSAAQPLRRSTRRRNGK